jgi:hypothetical protein
MQCAETGIRQYVAKLYDMYKHETPALPMKAQTSLLHMMACCGDLLAAETVFSCIAKKDLFAWTMILRMAYIDMDSKLWKYSRC